MIGNQKKISLNKHAILFFISQTHLEIIAHSSNGKKSQPLHIEPLILITQRILCVNIVQMVKSCAVLLLLLLCIRCKSHLLRVLRIMNGVNRSFLMQCSLCWRFVNGTKHGKFVCTHDADTYIHDREGELKKKKKYNTHPQHIHHMNVPFMLQAGRQAAKEA